MTNLYISIYPEKDHHRKAELSRCLQINFMNEQIDKVFLLEEEGHEMVIESEKVRVVPVIKRPTFGEIFGLINENTGPDDVNIIANSDIYFDELGIMYMNDYLAHHCCYALTRYDVIYNTAVFMDRRDSQDSWCFKGRVKDVMADFGMGISGCDNKIAWLLQRAGYLITNPSLTIRTYHLHKSPERNWHGQQQVPPPYLLLNPVEL